MATKGVPIDITRPLKMVNGTKITEVESCLSGEYRYICRFINKYGREDHWHYTHDGFVNSECKPDEEDRDLIYDQDEQQKFDNRESFRLPEHFHIIERKGSDDILIAVTKDNKMYWIVLANNIDGKWERLPDLPQD